MKRAIIVSVTVITGLFISGALLVGQTHVPTHDIERMVTRKPD